MGFSLQREWNNAKDTFNENTETKDITRVGVDLMTGGLAEPLYFIPKDATDKNAQAMREAGAAGTSAAQYAADKNYQGMIDAAKISSDAQDKANLDSIKAAKEATAANIAAAEKSKADAITATQNAIAVSNKAIQEGADTSNAIFRAAYEDIHQNLAPWIQTGQKANTRINALMGFDGEEAAKNALETDPSYLWRLEQGQKTLERSAIGNGNLLSGKTATDLIDYGQHAGSQEFSAMVNRLMGLSTQGLGATGSLNTARSGLAGAESENIWKVKSNESNNAMKLGDVEVQGGRDVLNATMGGNLQVSNAIGTGANRTADNTTNNAWNIANVGMQGNNSVAGAKTNEAGMDANASIMENNFLPNQINTLLNLGAQAAGMYYGSKAGNKYNSLYPTKTT